MLIFAHSLFYQRIGITDFRTFDRIQEKGTAANAENLINSKCNWVTKDKNILLYTFWP